MEGLRYPTWRQRPARRRAYRRVWHTGAWADPIDDRGISDRPPRNVIRSGARPDSADLCPRQYPRLRSGTPGSLPAAAESVHQRYTHANGEFFAGGLAWESGYR